MYSNNKGRSAPRARSFSKNGRGKSFGTRTGSSRFGAERTGNSYGTRTASAGSFARPKRNFGDRGARPSFGGGERRGRSFSGGRGGHSFNRGGDRRGGRRFVAPKIDIERFIAKSVAEVAKATVETPEVYTPQNDFRGLVKHAALQKTILGKGYSLPTPIQDQAIPHVREKKDVVGIANTGTGKTAAFLIPLIDHILHDKLMRVLVVVPTRELAAQIGDELRGFAQTLGITAAVCIGGSNIRAQQAALKHSQFVIGTPGRLKDLIERRSLNMGTISTIVLDEADRMLDMGFINDIRFLFSKMPQERHSLCFSATMSPEISKLINDFLKDPISVSVKKESTSRNVEQNVVRVTEGRSKVVMLEDLLREPDFKKVLVFGETKHGVENLTKKLREKGFRAESIHGNKSSSQRKRALDSFKTNRTQVLVATDVAARGLDISNVSHVINYDVPHSYEDYVHRIGRTGRGGAKGKAFTFVE